MENKTLIAVYGAERFEESAYIMMHLVSTLAFTVTFYLGYCYK